MKVNSKFFPSHHGKNGGYRNPPKWGVGVLERCSLTYFSTMIIEKCKRKKVVIPGKDILSLAEPNFFYPLEENDEYSDGKWGLYCTWIGHSTVYIQIASLDIALITDPIFSESLCGMFGLHRIRKSPCEISQLPKVDIVLISHDHRDHFDLSSLETIRKTFNPIFYVPKEVKGTYFSKMDTKKVIELDWWEDCKHENIKITCLPSQHNSGRGLLDRDTTLWCSWGLTISNDEKTNQELKIFFAGDTGYNRVMFEDIGKRFGHVDFSLIPIGAYEPNSIAKLAHMNPKEAVRCTMDIKSKVNIGIHWGTFILSMEQVMDPVKDLKRELKKLEYDDEKYFFGVLKHGETRVFEF